LSRLFISPSTISWGAGHPIGDTFTVEVRVTDVHDCFAVQFGLEWDSTVLELVEVVKGDFLEEEGVTTWWFPYSEPGYTVCGYMRFEASSGVDVSPPDSGLVATLKFKGLKTSASTNITFTEADCVWFDSAFNSYTFTELESAVFTFGVVAYPKLTIINVTAPSTASANETLEIKADWKNDGEAGTAWTRLIDLDTNEEVSPRTEFHVDKAQTGTVTHTVVMPNKDLKLRLEVGHVE